MTIMPCSEHLRNHLLARLVISKLDRSASFVVAVAECLHMLVLGSKELRELALPPLRMARRGRITDIADYGIAGLRFCLDGL
jgi:hypothetical protein